jgi:hypothetical protein
MSIAQHKKWPTMFERLVFATWFNYFDHATYVNFFKNMFLLGG